jgi:Fic family protein
VWHQEAHHSTAIEGNTLVLREVEALLDQGKSVGAKPLKDYLEVRGYGDAADWVYSQARKPTGDEESPWVLRAEIRQVHQMVMGPVWAVSPHRDATAKEAPGSFREHDIQPFEGGMTPPMWPLVPAELGGWVDEANSLDFGLRGSDLQALVEGLAGLHNRFERIHPFLDGNGRTGRLVLNLLLVRAGLPPIIIRKQKRVKYLRAMRYADHGSLETLGELFARAMEDSVYTFILPNLAGPAREVPLKALVTRSTSLVALRQAAQRGRLDAHQDSGGIWRSSRQAVAEYEASKRRREPRA